MTKVISYYGHQPVKNGQLAAGAQDPNQPSWYAAHSVESSFVRPTTLGTGYGCRYFRCDFYVSIAVLDDLSVWCSIDGGHIAAQKILSGGTYGWPKSFIAASLKPIKFAAYAGNADRYWVNENGHVDYFTYQKDVDRNWAQWGFSGNAFFTDFGIRATGQPGDAFSIYAPSWTNGNSDPGISSIVDFPSSSSEVYQGREFDGSASAFMNARGYSLIGNLATDASWGNDETGYYGYVYVGGCCLFNDSPPGIDTDYNAPKAIRIYGLQAALDYYPWGRHIGGEWRSHNRSGGSLKRYNGGWKDVKNSHGSGASKGFRHNGSTWAKSPKTGRE